MNRGRLIIVISGLLLTTCVIILFNENVGEVVPGVKSPSEEVRFTDTGSVSPASSMRIVSTAFAEGGSIPGEYTCDGEGSSPELHFADVPQAARSLVLLVDDPDVPTTIKADGVFDHWTLYDIDPDTRVIPKGGSNGTKGSNSTGKTGYVGPCPPDREHRYFFRLYALDTRFGFPPGKTKKEIQNTMKGHIIDEAVLVGRYDRKSKRRM